VTEYKIFGARNFHPRWYDTRWYGTKNRGAKNRRQKIESIYGIIIIIIKLFIRDGGQTAATYNSK